MIDLELDFDDMAAALQPLLEGWEDIVIPEAVELVTNPRYSPRYAWMFSYEKKLRDRIFAVLGRRNTDAERALFGADGVVSEGLSNAFLHGHGRDATWPIRVRCVVGKTGVAVSIVDQGSGFDVKEIIEKAAADKRYFHMAGNGMKAMLGREDVVASFSDEGSALNLLYRFE